MEAFIHPWYMAAGGLMVSLPILIHLINRMRFKRIRWAAMEFLLKAQKKNRRRLIVEQLILLLLRILLVLLAAFLVARFLFAGTGTKGATHVVIFDDTLSMGDRSRENNVDTTGFSAGVKELRQLVRNAKDATSAQMMQVYLLSDLGSKPFWEGRVSDRTEEQLAAKFEELGNKSGFTTVHPGVGVVKGVGLLDDVKDGGKILHVVSDFRERDWGSGQEGDKLVEDVKAALEKGINVNLIDVAAPYRAGSVKVALNHANLAITEFRPETRVAVEEADVEFLVKVMNYGNAEGKGFLKVYVSREEKQPDGTTRFKLEHDLTRDQVLEKIPAGRETEVKFTLRFPKKTRAGLDITDRDGPEERERKRRLEREYFQVRVDLGPEPEGLNADNVRDLVLEVRKKVPTLVVDGNRPENRGEGGDGFHLSAFYAASSIYEVEERKLADLEKADLDLYPSVILLNVGEVPPAVAARLKKYVEQGGSLCWFLGEDIKADHYNSVLFKERLFPLQLSDRPYDPLAASFPDPEARKKERDRLRQTDQQPKILFPNPAHPLVERLAPFRSVFRYMGVNLYWRAAPRGQWDPEPRKAEDLVVLPNASSIDKYKGRAKELAASAAKQAEQLARKETEFQRFVDPLTDYQRKVTNALASEQLFRLAEAFEGLLYDQGVKDDPKRPNMAPLWAHPSMKTLQAEIKEFRDDVLFGDPLVVSRREGKGRVVAVLTPAGTNMRRGVGGEDQVAWNNWGAGDPLVSQTYPLFLLDLHRYLISEGQAPNRTVGEGVELTFDASRYDRTVAWTFAGQPDLDKPEAPAPEEKDKAAMEIVGKTLKFELKPQATRKPGVYRVEFTLLGEGAPEDRKEVRAFAFNVNSEVDGDLKRATRERLDISLPGKNAQAGKVILRAPGGDGYESFKEKTPDASESPWLYLFFLLILVVEQAMAVHLSYHLKGNEPAMGGAQPAAA